MEEGLCSLLEYLDVLGHVKNGGSFSYWFVYFIIGMFGCVGTCKEWRLFLILVCILSFMNMR